jgi:hypothetical protein
MQAKDRRKVDMGKAALGFSREHPDDSPGYMAAVAQLVAALDRATLLINQQRVGLSDVRMASARKRDLQRSIKLSGLNHVAEVARNAERDVPELSQKFILPRGTRPFLAFRTAARGIQAEAQSRRELLVKYGLVDAVLEGLGHALDEFDAAVEQGAHGRQAHVGASSDLEAVASEVVQVVNVMDGMNRFRFAGQPEPLSAWEKASSITATPRTAVELKPAA